MTLEREFKVGDRVCSFRGKTGVVVRLSHPPIPELRVVIVQWDDGLKTGISESQVWHEGATPKFDYMAHQAQLEHEQALKRAEERRIVERAFDAELKNYPNGAKYHVNDRIFYPNYGCGTVINASAYIVTVKFANDYECSLATYPPLRFATEVDERYDPCAVVWAPEPVDEKATLDDLAREVSCWSEVVRCIDGDDDDDEIRHDLFVRECIHGTLNGLKKQCIEIPANLLQTLEEADRYFIENSFEVRFERLAIQSDVEQLKKRSPCMGAVTVYDAKLFWYKNRWPKKQGD